MTTNPHALTGAYVLDALEPAERGAFETHLAACEDCRAEVASLERAVVRLVLADAVVPPPELQAAVRARVARTPQVPPLRTAPDLRGARPEPAPGDDRAAATPPPARRRLTRRWPAVAAVAATLVLGVAVGTTVLEDRRHVQQVEAAQAAVMRIMSAPDAVSHDVDLGAAHVVMSAEMSAAALMGKDVPMPVGEHMVYQVWMVHDDGSCEPGPTFMPEHGEVTAIVEGDLGEARELMVTEEPEGGSAAPTGAPVATVEL